MRRLHTIRVIPSLPEPIERLRALAYDLHWTWNNDAIDLFRRLDPDHWREVGQNPIRQIAEMPQEKLDAAAKDEAFLSLLDKVDEQFQQYRDEHGWFKALHPDKDNMLVAYLSAEFGLHECLPMYSGGLGILAGDHLKAASDLGIPMVAVGLLYRRGYFRQYLNADGWQQESYPHYDTFNLPIEQLMGEDGEPVMFRMPVGGREVIVQIWRVKVGRIDLYMLDTGHIDNHPEDRRITEILYGGDTEMRIRQEIVLGIGGMRALATLGIAGSVYHMNEGHSAFLALERIRRRMDDHQLTFNEAREATRVSHVFTTHTPVPAGIDRFSQELVAKYFKDYWPQIGLDYNSFMALGGANPSDQASPFNMATLAINLSSYVNGVSKLHGDVSRKMWRHQWPSLDLNEIPIDSVTNGVHAESWLSPEMVHLFDRYVGPEWQYDEEDREVWGRVSKISNEELWRAKERSRQRLVVFARERLAQQLKRRGESRATVERAYDALDMEAFTIGFARRFATYKRANLLFRDKTRLIKLLKNPDMPVQLILAGKAHPKDEPGKNIIREIIHIARDEGVRDRIVFLENYDINVARHMVQGSDIWLNTPRVPMEASGTSGMKAVLNGTIHVSTFDGWWAEGYTPESGWTIGHGETYDDTEEQDQIESELLFDLLEKEIVPTFYNRNQGRVPRDWTEMIKRSLQHNCPYFNTNRMVREYTEKAYLPNHVNWEKIIGEDYGPAKRLSAWKEKVNQSWSSIRVQDVQLDSGKQILVGDKIEVSAAVHLGAMHPDDVQVEIYTSQTVDDVMHQVDKPIPMTAGEKRKDGAYEYTGILECYNSGAFSLSIRVLPRHELLRSPHELHLITWEE